jgi:hypothetical protein
MRGEWVICRHAPTCDLRHCAANAARLACDKAQETEEQAMKLLKAVILVICIVSVGSKVTAWTYRHFHSTEQVR